MNLPNYILFVLDRLKDHEAYVVGGSVRDHLLSRPISDYDITTSSDINTIQQLFYDQKQVLNGIKHGTVRIIIENHSVEITTYRIDGDYKDHRKPAKVTFTSNLYEDLSRRDFTINALCYHPQKGIIDMFDGISDLNNKTIRAIGDPNKRFDEDALRILRALRFASQLHFDIEPATAKAIHDNKKLLAYLSKERITNELQAIFSINDPKVLLKYEDIFSFIFDQEISMIKLIPSLQKSYDFTSSLSLLANHLGLDSLDKLSLSKQTKKLILNNLQHQNIDLNNKINIKKLMMHKVDIISLASFINASQENIDKAAILNKYQQILANHEPYSLSQLAINGHDLLTMDIPHNQISFALQHCLERVIENQLPNEKEALLKASFQLFH